MAREKPICQTQKTKVHRSLTESPLGPRWPFGPGNPGCPCKPSNPGLPGLPSSPFSPFLPGKWQEAEWQEAESPFGPGFPGNPGSPLEPYRSSKFISQGWFHYHIGGLLLSRLQYSKWTSREYTAKLLGDSFPYWESRETFWSWWAWISLGSTITWMTSHME